MKQEACDTPDATGPVEYKNRLRQLRALHHLKLAQLAAKTGLSVSYLSDLEHGRTMPSISTAQKLAEAYGITLSALLDVPGNPDTEALYREIGARIRDEREDLGFSQRELGEEIGLFQSAISRIEAGEQQIPIHLLLAIARALGVSASCLLPDTFLEEPERS